MLEADARLEENDTLVILSKHLHERLHKVLVAKGQRQCLGWSDAVGELTLISSHVSSSASSELKWCWIGTMRQ